MGQGTTRVYIEHVQKSTKVDKVGVNPPMVITQEVINQVHERLQWDLALLGVVLSHGSCY
jgi:hypothetical protein